MGYRNYFGKMKIEEVKKISVMNKEELEKYYDDEFIAPYEFSEEVWSFGKLYFDDTIERITCKSEELFKNKEVSEMMSDYCIYVVGKEGFEKAIEIYKNKVIEVLKQPCDEILKYNEQKLERWEKEPFGLTVLDTNLESKSIQNTWFYEYSIFEMVVVYKSIDWEKETIIFYGY